MFKIYTDVRDALQMMSTGIEPIDVTYDPRGELDVFVFRWTPWAALRLYQYHKRITKAVDRAYQDHGHAAVTEVCTVPGSRLNPEMVDECITPKGNYGEYLAYINMSIEDRQAYVAADPESRKAMIAAAYRRG